MTNAQLNYLNKLTGGLDATGDAAVAAGYIPYTRSNKRDRENMLLNGVSTAEASTMIAALKAVQAPVVATPVPSAAPVPHGHCRDCGQLRALLRGVCEDCQ